MADRFENFKSLAAEMRRDDDYRIRFQDRGSQVAVIAPHGGTIEPGTSEIAQTIAGEDLTFYTMEALKSDGFADFHITSHRFDEPEALALVGRVQTAIAIHGRRDDGTRTVWLGGRDTSLRDAIGTALRDAGFEAAPNTTLPGIHETNICNRTRSGKGAQLELPRSLRRELTADSALMADFCKAVREAIRLRPTAGV